MNRRLLLKAGVALGGLTAIGAGVRYAFIAPPRSPELGDVDELAAALYEALSDSVRGTACVEYDHPLRQYYNRGLWTGGQVVHAAALSWDARCTLTDLFYAGLSEVGRERLPRQMIINVPGVNLMQLLICGDPRAGPYQVILSQGHLNYRIGGKSIEGAAFGGPQVYGDQRGNGRVGLPDNTYHYQMQAAHRLWDGLTAAERSAVRVEQAPPQTRIDLQGVGGRFDGLAIAELSPVNRRRAREIVAGILETYAEQDVAYAWECIDRNGGVDALRFADYDIDFQGGRRAGDGPSQIFRLEGPAAVLYFRGEPHLHAFVNVVIDADRQLSIGDTLGENPRVLEGDSLQAFYETAMLEQAEADVAHYPAFSVVGRLRAGPVRTGDIWVAESWVNDLEVVEIKGEDLASPLVSRLRDRGIEPQRRATYKVAALDYVLDYERQRLGPIRSRRSLGLLREALTAHVKEHGFA